MDRSLVLQSQIWISCFSTTVFLNVESPLLSVWIILPSRQTDFYHAFGQCCAQWVSRCYCNPNTELVTCSTTIHSAKFLCILIQTYGWSWRVTTTYFSLSCSLNESHEFKNNKFGYAFLSLLIFRFPSLPFLYECD